MKALNKKLLSEKERLYRERKEAEEKAMLAAMSDNERAAYLSERAERQKKSLKQVAELAAITAAIGGPYGG